MGEAKRRRTSGDAARKRARQRHRSWLIGGGIAAAAVLLVGGFYALTNPSLSPVDDLPQATADAAPFPERFARYAVRIGDPDAPVVVREFADYQCPACARLAPAMARFKEAYVDSGQAQLVLFDFPLRQHRHAMPAALAARCALDQGEFWPFHERLFERQSHWAEADEPRTRFVDYARDLGLDETRFRRCLRSERHRDTIERNLEAARAFQVRATPTVFVGNVELTRPGWYQLAGVADRQLAAPEQSARMSDSR